MTCAGFELNAGTQAVDEMSLSRQHAIAFVPDIRLVAAYELRTAIDFAVRQNPQHTSVPFEYGVAHRRTRRLRVCVAVAIHNTIHTFVSENHDCAILAGEDRICATGVSENGADV